MFEHTGCFQVHLVIGADGLLIWCGGPGWTPAQAVYGVLKEAEHRSTFYIPYWNIPITRYIVPRQRKFNADLEVINNCLDGLIARAKQTRQADDVEALQARDYAKASTFLITAQAQTWPHMRRGGLVPACAEQH